MIATGTITISKVPDELAYGAYFAGQELGFLFNLDQDHDGVIDELSMVFSVDGRDITINTRDTQVAIRNVNAVTREELISLLVEDFGDDVKRPAFGPNRIFIASNKLGDGSSISVKEQGTMASKIGFHTIADNVPTGKDGDTVTIGSMEYVFIHAGENSLSLQNSTNRLKVVVGSTVDETAQNLAFAINSQASLDYTAIATNGVVTITAKVAGVSGNAIQLSKKDSDNDILLSDESLKGGQ